MFLKHDLFTLKGLDWIMKKADTFYHFALYDLDHLLLELVNLFPLAERQIPTVAMASMILQREIFLYERWVICREVLLFVEADKFAILSSCFGNRIRHKCHFKI